MKLFPFYARHISTGGIFKFSTENCSEVITKDAVWEIGDKLDHFKSCFNIEQWTPVENFSEFNKDQLTILRGELEVQGSQLSNLYLQGEDVAEQWNNNIKLQFHVLNLEKEKNFKKMGL